MHMDTSTNTPLGGGGRSARCTEEGRQAWFVTGFESQPCDFAEVTSLMLGLLVGKVGRITPIAQGGGEDDER